MGKIPSGNELLIHVLFRDLYYQSDFGSSEESFLKVVELWLSFETKSYTKYNKMTVGDKM